MCVKPCQSPPFNHELDLTVEVLLEIGSIWKLPFASADTGMWPNEVKNR